MLNYDLAYKKYPYVIWTLIRDNYKCAKCNTDYKLVVHHIDGSRKYGVSKMNNNLSNLMTLCKKCHAEAHGYIADKTRFNTIKNLYMENKSLGDIGKIFGVSRQRIYQIMIKNGMYPYLLDKRLAV